MSLIIKNMVNLSTAWNNNTTCDNNAMWTTWNVKSDNSNDPGKSFGNMDGDSKSYQSYCTYSNKYNENIIFTVISNKGGVGKTSLALIFSMLCSGSFGQKTLLLELDSSPGDFGSLFDIGQDKSLELALKFPEKYKKYTKKNCKNLDVLKGISNPLVAEGIKKGIIYNLLSCIGRDYRFIIVDTQTVINGVILDMLRVSNTIFVVSDFFIESISRIASLIDILVEKFSISKSKIKVIINKKRFFHFLRISDISKIIEFPVEAFISFDKNFDKSSFLLSRRKVFKTRFFKEASKILDKCSYCKEPVNGT